LIFYDRKRLISHKTDVWRTWKFIVIWWGGDNMRLNLDGWSLSELT